MTTETAPVAARTAPGERLRAGPLAVLMTGTFMTYLDFFIVNVAMPSLRTGLRASPSAIQFVVAGYALAFAAGLITGGRLGDLFGRRRMFGLGLGLFVLASAACGLAPTTAGLIAARVVQGGAAALLTPQVLALLSVLYPGPQRLRAFGVYGLVMGMAGVFGQLIGGALIRADIAGAGWRLIFFINVPVGLAGLAGLRLLPRSERGSARLDLAGVAIGSAALVALLVPLIQGRADGWPAWTWLSLAGSAVLLACFAGHQRWLEGRGGAPLVRLTLFTDRTFAAGFAIAVTFCLGLASFWLVLALYLQEGMALTPLASGTLFIAAGVGFTAAMLSVPALTPRLGKHILTAGALITAVGYLLAGATATMLGTHRAAGWMIPALVVAGAGIGLVLVPLSETVLARVKPEHAASGAGVLSTALQLGGALGVAILGAVFFGTLHGTHFAHAFTISMIVMAGCAAVSGALAMCLPRRILAR
jgi:EmrB/QacA subfamily drug resistance transporter